MTLPRIFNTVIAIIVAGALLAAGLSVYRWVEEKRILKQIVDRLSADSRVAEVLVTKSEYDEVRQKIKTTIKFLEYDSQGSPVAPKYFTFYGNIIQFQALVIRFEDDWIKSGDPLKGKSAYLFLKAFILNGKETQEFIITETETIPAGYKIAGSAHAVEEKFWTDFWDYAIKPEVRKRAGVKNAQIEAPGTMFLPGTIYTIFIEHDGGLRIDSRPIPEIVKGEMLS